MNSDLCCKIFVKKAGSGYVRGTGYPLSATRLITAWHVVEEAFSATPQVGERSTKIELQFGPTCRKVPSPEISLEWVDSKLDVAVLSCSLPNDLPIKQFDYAPSSTRREDWHSRGYTEYGREKNAVIQGGLDTFGGVFGPWSDTEPTIKIESTNGVKANTLPAQHEGWKGCSGTVVFVQYSDLLPEEHLGVVTQFLAGTERHQLVVVPFGYLLHHHPDAGAFRTAIFGKETENRIHELRQSVFNKVLGCIQKVTPETMTALHECVNTLLQDGDHNPLGSKPNDEQIAKAMLEKCDADLLTVELNRLLENVPKPDKLHCGMIARHILPLNYDPTLLNKAIHDHDKKLLIISGIAGNRAVAEAIAAGICNATMEFTPTSKERPQNITGLLALPWLETPEIGPAESTDEESAINRSASYVLSHIMALTDAGPPQRRRPVVFDADGAKNRISALKSPNDLVNEVNDQLQRFHAALRAIERHVKRPAYCIVELPTTKDVHEFHIKVLQSISRKVPNLLFIEITKKALCDRQRDLEHNLYYNLILTEDIT